MKIVLDDGFARALSPIGFVPSKGKTVWVRRSEELYHVISLLRRRGSCDVQWGITCLDVAEMMWGENHAVDDRARSIIGGFPSGIRHPACAQSFDLDELSSSPEVVAAGVASDVKAVAEWLEPFRRRRFLIDYLLMNRDHTDRRAFVVPSKLPLKLLTAAALAVVDNHPRAAEILNEAETALAKFDGDDVDPRLVRLRRRAVGAGWDLVHSGRETETKWEHGNKLDTSW